MVPTEAHLLNEALMSVCCPFTWTARLQPDESGSVSEPRTARWQVSK